MGNEQEIFDRIKQSHAFDERNTLARRERLPVVRLSMLFRSLLPFAIIGVVFPLCALTGIVTLVGNVGGKGFQRESLMLFGCAPAFLLLFLPIALIFFIRYRRYRDLPVEAEPALVISKHGRYKLTLEFEDGARREFEVWGGEHALYAQLGIGDAGIAFYQETRLLDFDRVR